MLWSEIKRKEPIGLEVSHMIRSEIINRGIDFIINHLNEDISIGDVARHCNYSKYYFSRMFKAETGQSVYAFIKRLKMDQSAISLQLENGRRITDIGLDYGYSSTNYSLTFQKHHNTSPSKFRKAMKDTYIESPFYQDNTSGFQSYENLNDKIKIQMLNEFTVAYERYIGNYIQLKDKWALFIQKYLLYIDEETQYIERSYDDPKITELDKCIFDMCFTVKHDCPLSNVTTIKGGKYAVYPYKGSIEGIYSAVQGIVHGWFPHSGFEKNGRHGLNVYRVMDISNLYVEIDICFPVK